MVDERGTVVATIVILCTCLVGQNIDKGGTRGADASPRSRDKVCNKTYKWCGDHRRSIMQPFCNEGNVCASLLPHLSEHWAIKLLDDFWVTILKRFKTSWWPRRPWQCLNIQSQIAKFMRPTWGPPGSCQPQMGPMLVPWTFLSGVNPLWMTKATIRPPFGLQRQPGQFYVYTRN